MTTLDHSSMDQFAAHLDRGWDLVTRGDYSGALHSAQKSLELDEQSPEAHNLVGFIHQAEGRADDALEHYKRALELDDTFVEAMLNAAEVMIGQRNFDGAVRMIDDALDLVENNEETADALLLKFDALYQSGDREGAKRVLKLLPEGPFENPNLDFLIGRAKLDLDELDEAEPLLRRAVKHDGQNGEAHYSLGVLLEKRGQKRESTLMFLQSRELDARLASAPWALAPADFEARVAKVIAALPEPMGMALNDALVVVSELPGPEVVADLQHPVDPRAPMLLEDLAAEDAKEPRVGRVFIYRRNVERLVPGADELDEELLHLFEQELVHAFPKLAEFAKTNVTVLQKS